jgi:hypothetical protein
MIDFRLDPEDSILSVHLKGPLSSADFARFASVVDPHIEATGGLGGIVLETEGFPGWQSFGALVSHFRFVRSHHEHVGKVALVTDSPLGDVAERLASHFVSAEIKHFPSGDVAAARRWILERRPRGGNPEETVGPR